MQRMMHLFPQQGNRDPWRNTQDYHLDKKLIRHAPLEDGALLFGPLDRPARSAESQGGPSEETRSAA